MSFWRAGFRCITCDIHDGVGSDGDRRRFQITIDTMVRGYRPR